jgi:zinc D-Ala-D-Ala carboxypeptidase
MGTVSNMGPGKYFTWSELTASGTANRRGLDNTPDATSRRRLTALVREVLDPLRAKRGAPIYLSSGYRSQAVNDAVNGSKTSQHMRGEAVDMVASPLGAEEFARWIDSTGIPFDQLIWYDVGRGGHVHISHRQTGNRRQILHAPDGGGYDKWRF